MLDNDKAQHLLTGGGNVIDNDGDKIGSIGQIFLDDESGRPEWVTVKTGLFGGGESFVPLRDAEVAGDDLRVPYEKATVKDAPRISDSDGHLSEDEEETLYRYYGTEGADYDTTYAHDVDSTTRGVGHDTSGPETDRG